MQPIIEIAGLYKGFGGRSVLEGVDLVVDPGCVFALLGPNGAGKTTLINILCTLVQPDRGVAKVAGADVVADPARVRQAITVTGQSVALDDMLTGTENLTMMARLSGLGRVSARQRAQELLERFGLAEAADKRVRTYSGGMRRRLDLAVSLIVPPTVLFLDEPTTGLDARSRRELWHDVRELRNEGTTVFLTTQYLEEADELADRVAVLDGGRIVAEGTPAELKSRTGSDVVELRDREDRLVRELQTDGTLAGLRMAIERLEEEFASGSVSVRKPSLDDVFLTLTGRTAHAAPQTPTAHREPVERTTAR